MSRTICYVMAGATAGCVFAAIEVGDLAGTSTRTAASLGGLGGLIVAFIDSAVRSSLRRHPVELPAEITPDKSDRMLVRATVILLTVTSPILLLCVNEAFSRRNPHWISSLFSHFFTVAMMALS